ncbi:MAG: phage/plasmid primase, P4 family [Caldilineaceae bacterium]
MAHDFVNNKNTHNDTIGWTTHPAGEYGNMLCFQEKHGDRIAFNSAYGWMYQGEQRRWLTGDVAEATIDQAAIDTLLERQRYAAAVQNDLIAQKSACTTRNISSMKSLLRPYITVTVDQFDNIPHLLNTKSGVIDLRTGRIVADESGRFTYCVNVDYDKDADHSHWLQFLDQTIEYHKDSETMRDYIQMGSGYSLTGSTREECLFYLHGPTRSGKGSVQSVMLELLKAPLATAAAFSTFTRRRDGNSFDLAPLKAARIVIASEGEKKSALNEATVKTITGRDRITCAFKGKDEFSYTPHYKIWLASNHPVAGDPDDDAFWNRVKIINCPWSKAGSEDKSLKDYMSSPEYLRGVLVYMVTGAKMWFNEPKGLMTPDCVRNAVQSHRDASDSIGQWLNDNTVKTEPRELIGHTKLFADYQNWCEENGYKAKQGKGFAQSMKAKGFEQQRTNAMRGYRGLDIKP